MQRKRILIFDECSFARICSALLHDAGYEAETVSDADNVPSVRDIRKFGLIITSYPFCTSIFKKLKNLGISTIILSDDIDENLFSNLKGFNNSYCMMKPLDYEKFRSLVRRIMGRRKASHGGYHYLVQ